MIIRINDNSTTNTCSSGGGHNIRRSGQGFGDGKGDIVRRGMTTIKADIGVVVSIVILPTSDR